MVIDNHWPLVLATSLRPWWFGKKRLFGVNSFCENERRSFGIRPCTCTSGRRTSYYWKELYMNKMRNYQTCSTKSTIFSQHSLQQRYLYQKSLAILYHFYQQCVLPNQLLNSYWPIFPRLVNPVFQKAMPPSHGELRHISSKILKLPLHFLTSKVPGAPNR